MAIPRVDQALVDQGLANSMEHARLLVMEGKVYLGGGKVAKASDKAKPTLMLTVRDGVKPFVSRGGLKLDKAMRVFGLDVMHRVCMDVGASTGGFTDVLLRRGAKKVYAIDVGFGLLDYTLRVDERVSVMEKTNARFLEPDAFAPRPEIGVTDVSFISLKSILPAAFSVLQGEHRRFVALIKPQFEARREQVGTGGIVRDPDVHAEVIQRIAAFVLSVGWRAQALSFSPITGAQGNIEYLIDLVPQAEAVCFVDEKIIATVVEEAHRAHAIGDEKSDMAKS